MGGEDSLLDLSCLHLIFKCLLIKNCSFRAEGEFWTHSPVPQIRFSLKTVSKGFMSDDKLLAKVSISDLLIIVGDKD